MPFARTCTLRTCNNLLNTCTGHHIQDRIVCNNVAQLLTNELQPCGIQLHLDAESSSEELNIVCQCVYWADAHQYTIGQLYDLLHTRCGFALSCGADTEPADVAACAAPAAAPASPCASPAAPCAAPCTSDKIALIFSGIPRENTLQDIFEAALTKAFQNIAEPSCDESASSDIVRRVWLNRDQVLEFNVLFNAPKIIDVSSAQEPDESLDELQDDLSAVFIIDIGKFGDLFRHCAYLLNHCFGVWDEASTDFCDYISEGLKKLNYQAIASSTDLLRGPQFEAFL